MTADVSTFGVLTQYAKDNHYDNPTTAGLRKLKQICNESIRRAYNLGSWPFLENRLGRIVLVAPYSTGTIDVTNDSTTVDGTGVVFTAAQVGGWLRVSGDIIDYRIASRTDADTFELETEYQGDTDTGASYEIIFDTYDLPSDFGAMVDEPVSTRLVGTLQPMQDWSLYINNRLNWDRSGQPELYLIDMKTQSMILIPAPDMAEQLTFTYDIGFTDLTSDSDVLNWPDRFKDVIFRFIDAGIARLDKKVAESVALEQIAIREGKKTLSKAAGKRESAQRQPFMSRGMKDDERRLTGPPKIRSFNEGAN